MLGYVECLGCPDEWILVDEHDKNGTLFQKLFMCTIVQSTVCTRYVSFVIK